MMQDFFKKHFNRSFRIDLEENNSFPLVKGFVYPNQLIQLIAIEKYCIASGESYEIISKSPIIFRLNKEMWKAELIRHMNKFGYYYNIKCIEYKEES